MGVPDDVTWIPSGVLNRHIDADALLRTWMTPIVMTIKHWYLFFYIISPHWQVYQNTVVTLTPMFDNRLKAGVLVLEVHFRRASISYTSVRSLRHPWIYLPEDVFASYSIHWIEACLRHVVWNSKVISPEKKGRESDFLDFGWTPFRHVKQFSLSFGFGSLGVPNLT